MLHTNRYNLDCWTSSAATGNVIFGSVGTLVELSLTEDAPLGLIPIEGKKISASASMTHYVSFLVNPTQILLSFTFLLPLSASCTMFTIIFLSHSLSFSLFPGYNQSLKIVSSDSIAEEQKYSDIKFI